MNDRRLSIRGKETVLDGIAFFPDGKPKSTVIICHGLPKGIPEAEDENDTGYPGLAKQFVNKGHATVIFNFRGTGESGGSLEVAQWPNDLRSVLDFLEKEDNLFAENYSVIGFSTGGAAAILASASDSRIEPLITGAAPADFEFLYENEDPSLWFEHYKNIGMIHPDYEGTVAQWMENFKKLNSRIAMPSVKASSVLIIHGENDETVPVEHAKILAEASPGSVCLEILPNAGHQLRKDQKAVDTILNYLDQYFIGGEND